MEPKICNVLDCSSRSDKCDEDVRFYGFPRKPKYRQAWVAATGREQWSAKKSSTICSKHFLPACFTEGEGKSLLDDAVPTEFIKTPPSKESSPPELTVPNEQHLEPDEIEEPVEWLERGVNHPMEMRNLLEDPTTPNSIELRS